MSVKSSFRSGDDELDRLVGLGITRQQVEPGDDRLGSLDCVDPEILAAYADDGLSEAERADTDNHLARCRDCRRALALLLDSLGAATPLLTHQDDKANEADDRRNAASRSRILHSAKIWLPLAAALVVATGLWFAFDRTRQSAGHAPAFVNARNEPSPASQAASEAAPQEGAAPQRGLGGASPSAPSTSARTSGLQERGAAPADQTAALRAATQEPEAARGGAPAASVPAPAETSAPAPTSASPAFRAREARSDGFAAARPQAEADARDKPVALARPTAPAPPPPPPPSLADAAPARSGVAGRDAQAGGAGTGAGTGSGAGAAAGSGQAVGRVAGQIAPSPAQAPAAQQPPGQTVVDATQAKQAQAAQANQNQATQNVAQQGYVINQQQTGPSANLNVASPPPSKTDDRRQADASKREANEKTSAGGPSSAKSADEKFAKVAEEPKTAARAKAAPESAAAAAPAPPAEPATRAANAASGGAAPAGAASGGKASGAVGGRAGATAPESTSAASTPASSGAGAGAADRSTPGTRAGETGGRGINEAVTITTTGARAASAASAVLRSADGTRWWRIRAPGTIEGSGDRGATWTAEYSEPSNVIVRGVAGSKSGCWMVGRQGLVLRARPNGGWERVKQPTANGLVNVTATDHLIATVTDDRGRTYRTIDGGVTWR